MRQDLENKEAHLANLIKIAKADGVLHPMESIFIQGIAMRMGIPQTSFSRIAAMPDLAPTTVPEDDETKFRQFCELVILSQVDFMKSDDEKKLLYEIGVHMHIPSQKVDNLEKFLSQNRMPDDVSELMTSL